MSKMWKSFVIGALVMCCLMACRGVGEQSMTGTQDTDETVSSTDTMQETETQTETQIETQTETVDPEQAEKERIITQMNLYRAIVESLRTHEYGDSIAISAGNYDVVYDSFDRVYRNNEALEYAYHKLIELEELDSLLNEEDWISYVPYGSIPDFDRKSFLERFYIVEDVPIKIKCETSYDDADLRIDEDWVTFHYNTDGTLCYIDNGVENLDEYRLHRKASFQDLYYYYQNDKIVKMYFGEYEDKSAHWVREYDKKGHLIAEYIKKEKVSDRIDYIYNESEQLIQSVMYTQMDSLEETYPELSQGYFTDYTYDENGLLINKEERWMQCSVDGKPLYCHSSSTWDYTYDDSGKLVSVVQTERMFSLLDSEQYLVELLRIGVAYVSYAYDEEGRLLTKTTVTMPTEDIGNPDFISEKTTEVETYIYGDYYMYGQYDEP